MSPALLHRLKKEESRRFKLKNISKHPTKIISIKNKKIEVDVDMIPVIEWLNSLQGVTTRFCCQGDINFSIIDKKNKSLFQRPYVIWQSSTQTNVEAILKKFNEFETFSTIPVVYSEISTQIQFYGPESFDEAPYVRYISEWYDNLSLNDFVEFLNREKNNV